MTVIRLRKRLIGAEDISFDSGNRNETFQTDGTSFPLQKLNDSPLTRTRHWQPDRLSAADCPELYVA